MDNRCFLEELFLISVARLLIPDYEQWARAWMYANGVDVHPSDSTNRLLTRLEDDQLIDLSGHTKNKLEGDHGQKT